MKLQLGVIHGIVGTILMLFTVHMNETILDFRQIAVILSALYGGLLSSVITGVIICLVRWLVFGTDNYATIIAAVNTIAVAIAVGIACSRRWSYWSKWSVSVLICILFTGAIFVFNLRTDALVPVVSYACMMAVGGLLTAHLTAFFIRTKAHSLRMEKEATVDFLTGLNNHRTFDNRYNALLDSASLKSECLSVALLDIDHFKKVNDTYGHANGDAVLKQLSLLLQSSARPFDIVSRNGGEEFSVLFYDTPHEHALLIAERIRSAVSQHIFELNEGQRIRLTISIGVATYPDTKPEALREQADQALYQAKANGRNRVCSNMNLSLGVHSMVTG
ncbi:diguanylate cyclase [Paenibacillus phyllosphaerae]|uniref:Diguanylate cyclase n=2 Tax=Paenibacillus phyllosphaerae TaxID=274593 RepID=A0A7W5FMP4_9BACL|nr:diguanylate cyclase [Paenibacillus phyllosphaerae]